MMYNSKRKSNVKGKILVDAFLSCQRSKVIFFLLLSLFSMIMLILTIYWHIIILPLLYLLKYSKELIFEILVIIHYVDSNFPWYTKVDDDGIYLGAIPILDNHKDILSKKLNINCVLSVNEDYELNCSTLIGTPITSDEWRSVGIENLVLNSPDFQPPPFDLLIKGSDWINKQVIQHKKVYVHCKSGMGRSASIIAAYLMRYKFMDPHSARASLASKRHVVFGIKSRQLKNLINFESWLLDRKE